MPQVDETVWRQLRKETKSYDFAMQQCQQAMCLAMVPTLKALKTLTENAPNITTLNKYVGDTMQVIAQSIIQSNESHMD